MEIEKKVEELSKVVHDFKESNDKELAAIKTKGFATAEQKEITDRISDKITELETNLKKMQTAMARVPTGENSDDGKKAEYKKAFDKYVRRGSDGEIKALSVDSDPDGGYLVVPEMSSEIVKKVFESSPLRQLASVQSISGDTLELIEDLDEVGSGWVGETESRPETDSPQLNKLIITAHEMYAMPKASQKLLDDANLNVEAWLSEHISAKFGRDEATAFITGNGVNKPMGIMSYASGTSFGQVEQINSGSSGAFTADGLIDLVYGLKEPYKANAVFLMARSSVKLVRKLKDSQNQYLWAPGLNGNSQSQLLGFPIYEAADVAAASASSLSAAFGDFRAAYQIVDRVGIRMLRDPYSSKPHILFYTTRRVGGAVKNFEAFKIHKLAV